MRVLSSSYGCGGVALNRCRGLCSAVTVGSAVAASVRFLLEGFLMGVGGSELVSEARFLLRNCLRVAPMAITGCELPECGRAGS